MNTEILITKINKITNKNCLIQAVTITSILIVAAFLMNSLNGFNAYYIKPIKYCLCLIFIGLLLKRPKSRILQILLSFLVIYNMMSLTYLELEMWQGNNLALPFDGMRMMHIRVVINWILILGVLAVSVLIFGSLKRGVLVSSVLFCLLGIASYIVVEFRGEVLLPTDLAALSTALNVAGTYHLTLKSNCFAAILCFITILVWNRLLIEDPVYKTKKRLTAALIAFLIFWSFSIFEVEKYYYPWFIPNNGYTFAIATNIKMLNIRPEEDYTEEKVRDLIEEVGEQNFFNGYSASQEIATTFGSNTEDPNIICIMNESFSDLSQFSDYFNTDENLTPFINSLKDETIQGDLIVEVFGGGTSDTEFSFFTGLSTKLFPTNARAYELYIKNDTPNYVRNLKEQGYITTAIHPDEPSNWNRDNVYPKLGFDKFISINDFTEPEIIRDIFISDRESYKKVINEFENKGEDPIFIFDLTIQNHGSYDQSYSNLEKVSFIDSNQKYTKAEQYLSLIRESDEAFKELIEYFSKVDEPTVVLMFGDHLPKLEDEFYSESLRANDSEDLKDNRKLYTTPFVIWANYDPPEDTIDQISINYLSSLLTEISGTTKTPFNNYLTYLYNKFPVIDKKGVTDSNGTVSYYSELRDPNAKEILNYNNIIYNALLEDSNNNIDLFNVENKNGK